MSKEKIASVFVDLETLSKWDSAIILSAGICVLKDSDINTPDLEYDFFLDNAMEVKFSILEQKGLGRIFSRDTLDWWKGQGEEAKRVLLPSPKDCSINSLFDALGAFCMDRGVSLAFDCRVFDRSGFDMTKLQHLYEITLGLGKDLPWNPKEKWSIETLLRFNSPEQNRYGAIDPKTFSHPRFIYHSAACDAALDAFRFYKLMNGATNEDKLAEA